MHVLFLVLQVVHISTFASYIWNLPKNRCIFVRASNLFCSPHEGSIFFGLKRPGWELKKQHLLYKGKHFGLWNYHFWTHVELSFLNTCVFFAWSWYYGLVMLTKMILTCKGSLCRWLSRVLPMWTCFVYELCLATGHWRFNCPKCIIRNWTCWDLRIGHLGMLKLLLSSFTYKGFLNLLPTLWGSEVHRSCRPL